MLSSAPTPTLPRMRGRGREGDCFASLAMTVKPFIGYLEHFLFK